MCMYMFEQIFEDNRLLKRCFNQYSKLDIKAVQKNIESSITNGIPK